MSTKLMALNKEKYISLTTYRRSGKAVATPVWFVLDGERLFVWTGAQSGKVKRLRNNPEALVASCTSRGKVTSEAFRATVRIVPEASGQRAQVLLNQKYGLMKRGIEVLNTIVRIVRRRPKGESVYLEITSV